ncbi:MAG: EAL domain-containing protein [Thermodesulfobacterium sp.]|nr:EAL domain-containing protein [Thermodesulfobacterium sp.]
MLVKNLNLELAWIGIPDEEKGIIKPIYHYGYKKKYLEKIKISLNENLAEGRGPTAKAFRTGKIIIIPDSRTNPDFLPWREKALNYGLFSSCAIPLKKNNKVVAILNLYASEPHFFDEILKPLLEEIQRDLIFALKKIDEIKNKFIIATAVAGVKDWVIVTDKNSYILEVNNAVCKTTNYLKEELIGKHISILDNPIALPETLEKFEPIIYEKYENVSIKKTKDGKEIFLRQEIIPVELPGNIINFVIIGKDITEELKFLNKLEKFKNRDLLTGLLNLDTFEIKVDEILKYFYNTALLILLDIWGMSHINHIYGLETGNKLIKELAFTLKNIFKDNAILGRLGGDKFGIFLYKFNDFETLAIVKLLERFQKTLKFNDISLNVKVNIGCSIFPMDGENFKTLYEKADISLKEAKLQGPGTVVFYNPIFKERLQRNLRAENLIVKALEKDLFIFYYQPYFYTENLQLAGFEALVRIKDEDGKIYYPDSFIDYLEAYEEYLFRFEKIGLDKITTKIKSWKKVLSFNLSIKSLLNTAFIRKMGELPLEISKNLIIEITERELAKTINIAKQNIEYLKTQNMQIKLAIDDFGTGHASFSYLKDLPVDYVKIDMLFINDLTKGEKEKNLVKGIIDLSHNLGFKTIAEGVETEEHYKILKDLGCDIVQGFYFSKPLPAEEIEKMYLTIRK